MTQFNRRTLTQDLNAYRAENSEIIDRFVALLENENCFYRTSFPAHITGSAILLNPRGDQVLMNHHKTLNKWLNFGGHADGEEDILSVAIRETMEESGITALKPVTSDIIDLDIHPIPANPNKDEPEHFHYDIRYVMQMTSEQMPTISDESTDLQWMTFDDVFTIANDNPSLARLVKKVCDLL